MTEYDKTQGNMPWPVKREVQKRIVHSGGQYWPVKAWLVKRYSFSPLPFKGHWTPFVLGKIAFHYFCQKNLELSCGQFMPWAQFDAGGDRIW